jgi:hypothetical protein
MMRYANFQAVEERLILFKFTPVIAVTALLIQIVWNPTFVVSISFSETSVNRQVARDFIAPEILAAD